MSLCLLTNRFDFDDGYAIEVSPIYGKIDPESEPVLKKAMVNMYLNHRHQWLEFIPIDIFMEMAKDNDANDNLVIRDQVEKYHELKKLAK